MTGLRDRVTAVAAVAFGAMWLFAAGAKIASPLDVYEFTARIVPAGGAAKAALAAAVAGEALLGAAMLLRAVDGLWASLAALAVASAALLRVRATTSALIPCGCFGPALGGTIDEALVRNAVMGAVLAGLILWKLAARRR